MLKDWVFAHSASLLFCFLSSCCFYISYTLNLYIWTIYAFVNFSCFVQLIVVAQQTVFSRKWSIACMCVGEMVHARASLFHYLPFATTKSSNHYAQAFIWLLKLPASPEKARRFSLTLSLLVWSPDSYRKSFVCHVKTFMAQTFSNQRKGTQQGWLSRQWLL